MKDLAQYCKLPDIAAILHTIIVTNKSDQEIVLDCSGEEIQMFSIHFPNYSCIDLFGNKMMLAYTNLITEVNKMCKLGTLFVSIQLIPPLIATQ